MNAHVGFGALTTHLVPRPPALVLCYPNEQHRQPPQEHMGPNAVLQAVVDRPDVHHVLEVPKDPLDLPQPL